MTFPTKLASFFLLGSSIFSAFVISVALRPATGSSTVNVPSGINELLSSLIPPPRVADGPLLLPDHPMITLPPNLNSDLSASTSNIQPFTHNEYITAIHEAIQTVKAQFPDAFLTEIDMASVDMSSYSPGNDTMTDISHSKSFLLRFESLHPYFDIVLFGRRNVSEHRVHWYDPRDSGPVEPAPPSSPEIAWPPKIDVFQANEAKVAANMTEAYQTVRYYYYDYWKKPSGEGPWLVYEFATEQLTKVIALVSGETGKVLPLPPSLLPPKMGTNSS